MNNNEIFFLANKKAKAIGIILIVIDLLLIYVNTKVSWKIVGAIILIGLIIEEIEIFCIRISIKEDKLVIKSLFENKYFLWSEIKKIYMRREFQGKVTTIEIEGVTKKTSVTSFHDNYKLLTKIIVDHCKDNKLTYITEEVLKFIE